MKKLLVGVIGLGWALVAQPDGIDLSELEFREHTLTWLNVELTEPRSFGYGGREPHRDPLVESRMHHVDKVFERLELKIRDDKLHESIVKKKNLRKRYSELFLSREQREFRQKVQEYWQLEYQLYERWCGTGVLPILFESDPRLGRIDEMRAEVERLGLGDMTVSQKNKADAKAEFWNWVRRYKKEQARQRLEFNIERPELPGKELLFPIHFAHPAIPGIELDD